MSLQSDKEYSVGRMLWDGHCRGRWTLEALDTPSGGAHPRGPMAHRNLAREWAAAHPAEAELIQTQAMEAEAVPSLTPVAA